MTANVHRSLERHFHDLGWPQTGGSRVLNGSVLTTATERQGGKMAWQQEVPMAMPGANLDRGHQWQHDFVVEWHRLSEGCADLEQTANFATELYALQGTRSPVEVAREAWGVAV
ncbi:hypothetical protein [Variovorax guangxiensis]|uniref:hypothetical protein n=1 Tax=Variovorax guangxiensis TaxID=1775474 RepID=UPI0028571190|nr:hypothetical protein [Variovorax guangxiensis]MDR6859976.1 hypothetical protein [Variovorax guangxiensis]